MDGYEKPPLSCCLPFLQQANSKNVEKKKTKTENDKSRNT